MSQWLNRKCADVEKLTDTGAVGKHEKIKEVTGKTTHSSQEYMKSEERTIIMWKGKVLQRWKQYVSEITHDDKGEKPTLQKRKIGKTRDKNKLIMNGNSQNKRKESSKNRCGCHRDAYRFLGFMSLWHDNCDIQ